MPENNVVAMAENITSDAFHRILNLAISGSGKLPGAKATANRLLEQRGNPESAIKWLVNEHVAMASGQGFATNWGGFLVSLVMVPANLASATFVQARMVSAIAHLRGYELADPRVRTAILMIMLGPGGNASLISKGVLPSSPVAVATAPVFDSQLDSHVSLALLDRAMNQVGGKRFGVWAAKGIPLLGGGVGAAVDGWSTHSIARHALEELPSRRPRLKSGWAEQEEQE